MLGIIVWTIFIAIATNIILKKFHLPTIVGYIATGTAIAYIFGLHDLSANDDLHHIAEFGIVFLMFTIGLELSVSHLFRMKYDVFITGTLQILSTTFFTFSIMHYFFSIQTESALIIASALALSSTAIVLKLFNENGQINRKHGQRVLGILIMQDIAVIPILLMIGFFSLEDGQDISRILLDTLIGAVVLIISMWLLGRYVLEAFFEMIVKTKSEELFLGSVLLIAIGSSYASYLFGFSYSLGAFIAGMLIAETHYKNQVEADLIPFRDLLLGVFFITVGMQINFAVISQHILDILAILVFLMLMKLGIVYLIIRVKDAPRVAMKTALSLMQVGEFALVILEVANTHNLIDPTHLQILISTVIISMLSTPLIINKLSDITEKLIISDQPEELESHFDVQGYENHIIILGYGHFGQELAKDLRAKNREYIVIEYNIELFKKGVENGEAILFGNAAKRHILEHAQINSAQAIIVAIDNPKKLLMVCESIMQINEQDNLIVRVSQMSEFQALKHLGIQNVIIESQEMAKVIVQKVDEF